MMLMYIFKCNCSIWTVSQWQSYKLQLKVFTADYCTLSQIPKTDQYVIVSIFLLNKNSPKTADHKPTGDKIITFKDLTDCLLCQCWLLKLILN